MHTRCHDMLKVVEQDTMKLRPTTIAFGAAGLLTGGRAGIELADPAYYNPVTLLDYTAAIGSSVAWGAMAVALFLWWRITAKRRGAIFLLLAAAGVSVSSLGNLLEDVFDVGFGEFLFSYGGMIGAISLMAAAVVAFVGWGQLRRSGLFLLGVVAGSIFPDNGGEFLIGASLIGFGFWLWRADLTHLQITPDV
jgi:hypothetical protein